MKGDRLIRARRGTSPQEVAAAVAAVGRTDARDFRGRGLTLYPVGLKEDVVAPLRPALVVLGVLIGAPGIYMAGRLVGGMLVDVPPSDPLTLAVVAGGLVAITMATCCVAARPVRSIEPARLLRQE